MKKLIRACYWIVLLKPTQQICCHFKKQSNKNKNTKDANKLQIGRQTSYLFITRKTKQMYIKTILSF